MEAQYSLLLNLPSSLSTTGAKTSLAVFTYALDGINTTTRTIIDHVIEHPWLYGIIAAFIIGGILFIMVPVLVGFGPLGPISGEPPDFRFRSITNQHEIGSWAALWQSWIGNVAKGSLFAILQSLTMTGVFNTIGAAMIAVGVAGTAAALLDAFSGGKEHESGSADEIMARAADFATQYRVWVGKEFEVAGIIARAADVAAQYGGGFYAGGAGGLAIRAAEFAAQYDVNYYTAKAAGMVSRVGRIAGQYGASGSREAAGILSWAAKLAAHYGWA